MNNEYEKYLLLSCLNIKSLELAHIDRLLLKRCQQLKMFKHTIIFNRMIGGVEGVVGVVGVNCGLNFLEDDSFISSEILSSISVSVFKVLDSSLSVVVVSAVIVVIQSQGSWIHCHSCHYH